MDFITICFEKDLPQMLLQAKSMSLFLKEFPVEKIIVVLNADHGLNYISNEILPAYGHLKSKVSIITASRLVKDIISPCAFCKNKKITENKVCTYCHQQLLKILATGHCLSDTICILDAKIWFTRPWKIEDVFDSAHKLRLCYDTNKNTHWEKHRRNSWKYFELEYKEQPAVVNIAPFFLTKEIADFIVNKSDLVSHWNNTPMAEFYLIEAATVKKSGSLENCYWPSKSFSRTIWPFLFDQLDMDQLLDYFISPNEEFICSGLHRLSYQKLTEKNIIDLVKNYTDLNLLTEQETRSLISKMIELNAN